MSNNSHSQSPSNTSNSDKDTTASKRVEAVENSSLAQGDEVNDNAQLGADNDADVGATSQNNVTIETATKATDKRIVVDDNNRDDVVVDDDTKRASGNRSNSEFRQSDQHGNMTRPDDRRQGKGGNANSHFVKP